MEVNFSFCHFYFAKVKKINYIASCLLNKKQ